MPGKTQYAKLARYRCPIDGCDQVATRSNIWTHLQAVSYPMHGLDKVGARALMDSVVLEVVERPAPVVKRERPVAAKPVNPFKSIEPTDVALAVVQSQVNGHVASSLLPDIVRYVDATRELIAKLRSY